MLFIGILSLVVSVVTLIGGAYVVVKSRGLVRENLDIIEDYFSSSEGEPSSFNKVVDTTGQYIARQVTEGVAGYLSASIGGTMKGATAELESQAISENPVLAIMEGMPKSIKKNPLASLAMQTLLNRNMPNQSFGNNGNKPVARIQHRQDI